MPGDASHRRSAGSPARMAAGIGLRLAVMGRAVFSLLVPPLCLGCAAVIGAEERWLCADCLRRVSQAARPRTRTVGPGAAQLRISYALEYTPLVSKLVTELKYGDKPGLAGLLAPLMNSALPGPVAEGTAVVPVPVHPSRKRERGYNQSKLLAERIARLRGLPLECGVLLKTKNTVSQTGLERNRRMDNVAGSFGLRRPDRLSGLRVLLVDDVVTTGSTLKECARALLESGAMEVSACVAASSS